MNQINFTKKAVVLSVLFTVVILCGMMLFAASTSSGNLIPQTRTPEGQLQSEQLEAKEELLNKFGNINEAIVSFEIPDDGISMTYVFILAAEKIKESEINDITDYIREYLDFFNNEEIFITYIDPSYRVLKEIYPLR